MTDSANLLTGTTSENLTAGSATFNNLIIPSTTQQRHLYRNAGAQSTIESNRNRDR